jgi:hypothetical protein
VVATLARKVVPKRVEARNAKMHPAAILGEQGTLEKFGYWSQTNVILQRRAFTMLL